MTRWPVVFSLALTGAMLTALSARAQRNEGVPPEGPRQKKAVGAGMGDTSMGGIGLLRADQIQKELQLTNEQKMKLLLLVKDMRGNRAYVEKQLAEILTPAQVERLKQIHMQIEGAAALMNPKVVKALELTDDQRAKLKAIIGGKMRGAIPGAKDMTPEQRRARAAEMRVKTQQSAEDILEKALEVLTPEQREIFEKMKGNKVDMDISKLMPQGPGKK